MTETREIVLGGQTFAVPRLPLWANRKAYPLCRDLLASGFLERLTVENSIVEIGNEELTVLAELAFIGASAGDRTVTQENFEEMPITLPELVAAFFEIMWQTGGWGLPALPVEA